ncbi:LysR family transcriptional regulator [Guptibacillus hwajinpoensis]|uniref:DNA-binding transcriptional LysR family regulator n=1 Tax=Guptibacillus hwajinpoensis TaxID=208199 RepID=A0ABU0K5N7_9BACL|nr:LysR family transcriptional regulator [Alkalihalobacillus hemicentroti]MDQ0483821.1 DNA-binding transcriptional LysR family regulator [Alkalihalobacillus hemicentroti]
MDLNYFYTFKEVVKWGSYTQTAEELGYAQSSVTTQIKKLEEHYQVKLFERVGRKMRLTQSGEQLYDYVKGIIKLADEAEEQMRSDSNLKGSVRIGTVESLAAYFITPFIKSLKQQHPELRILLESGLCPNLIEGTMDGTYDIALLLDRLQKHPELTTIPIRQEEMVLIAPPDHPLTKLDEVTLKRLETETLILTEEGCSYRVLLEQLLQEEEVQAKSVISFSSLEAIKQCVADDLGIALLPRIAVERDVRNGNIVALPFHQNNIKIYTQVMYQQKKWISPPLKQFLSLLES